MSSDAAGAGAGSGAGSGTGSGAVAALQALVRIPTVSRADRDEQDQDAFDAFLAELARLFPLLHARLELIRVQRHGLLFHWAGARAERPVVLMAHLDVVPVEGGEGRWTHDPFSGDVVDGAVWGRGTLDDKGALVAICAAVEDLLEQDHVPAQDVWLSFGCDEEVFGSAARAAVAELRRREVRPWFVVDEGGAVAAGAFPGIGTPLAVVGVTEKGVLSVLLRAEGRGGHASTPARGGPTARVARAVTRIDAGPMPPRLPPATVEMFRRLAPHAPLALRPVLARADRLTPVLTRLLTALGPEPAALARTTLAVTTLSGSPALNVVAASATAGVNARVMLGDTTDDVLAHLRRTVADDSIELEVVERHEPSPLSPYDDDPAFALIEATIGEVFPDAAVTPYVMMAATDSRHFTAICDRVYRFAPFRMSRAQRQAIHSFDEHLGVEAFTEGVRWFTTLLRRLPA